MNITSLLEYIQTVQPDIIALQDANTRAISFLKQSMLKMHITSSPGFILLSRWPITNTKLYQAKKSEGWGRGAHYTIKAPFENFHLFSIYLESPREGIESILFKRNAEAIQKMQYTTQLQEEGSSITSHWMIENKPAIIVGDFNIPKQSPIYRKYWSHLSSAFTTSGWGFGHTKFTSWYSVRIDHQLYNSFWQAQKSYVGPDLGGDHKPLVTNFIFKEQHPIIQNNMPQKRTSETWESTESFLYGENFNHSIGVFKPSRDITVSLKPQNNGQGKVLVIKKNFGAKDAVLRITPSIWNIQKYGTIKFSYKILEGEPVGLKVQTRFGDWLCVGGTPTYSCDQTWSKLKISLIDDGEWHDIIFDVKKSVHSMVSSLKTLKEFQFDFNRALSGEQVLSLDNFRITK